MLTAASRRAALATAACLCIPAPSPASGVTTLKLPLQMQAGGVLTTGVVIDGEPFRLIVDSGSPYLVVPLDDCDQQPPKLSAYGCADAGRFPPAAFAATEEQYGALPGRMQWLRGDVSFGETEALPRRTGRRVGGELVFGGADRNVMSQSGGALLGLIREVNRDPRLSNYPVAQLRPTALAQLQMRSFRLDAPQRGGRRCRLACLTTATLHTARLVASTAQAAPTRPGAPHEQLESLPRPHKPPWCTPTRRQGARSP